MRAIRRLSGAILSLLVCACSSVFVSPTPEARQTLAPTGKLRVGVLPARPWSILIDSASGRHRGVGYELGQALAARLGVPFELVVLTNSGEFVDALRSGKADVILSNATPARAREIDYSPPVLEIEQGFLVGAGSQVWSQAQLDRPGVRVGVSTGSSSHAILSREFRNAGLVQVPTIRDAVEMMTARKLDAFASNKSTLLEMTGELPGARMLDGRYGVEYMALGIPKGRESGMAYLRRFAEDAKSEGLVARAAERAGLSAGRTNGN